MTEIKGTKTFQCGSGDMGILWWGKKCPRCKMGVDTDGDGDCAVCGDLTDEQLKEKWPTRQPAS